MAGFSDMSGLVMAALTRWVALASAGLGGPIPRAGAPNHALSSESAQAPLPAGGLEPSPLNPSARPRFGRVGAPLVPNGVTRGATQYRNHH
jgi:hypothetical protein